ncbi:hypothetical protein L3081_13875 [Colwellia sp. MSW7]|uniref:Alpha-glycerophosphate oxidase C-terminal domain-containing protein n=1 Tax=Colwellia maritima TaxID=2912588 RepID=A0ABS9X213_9GAMM|nr:hypothetical protein [Colwellia maritima]
MTVIGTTDLDHKENLDNEAQISTDEIAYLLKAVNTTFSGNAITIDDIISTFSGVRPVISSDKNTYDKKSTIKHFSKSASEERRDHSIWAEDALVTASGGKLTTFRLTAIEAVNAALPWLKDTLPISNQDKNKSNDAIFTNYSVEQLFKNELAAGKYDKPWLERLLGRYGNNAALLLAQADEKETIKIADTQFCLAECRWAIKHEAVIHLDDLLLRRTRLGLLLHNGAEALFSSLAIIFTQELGRTTTKWQDELTRYQKIWQQYYSLPKSLLKTAHPK